MTPDHRSRRQFLKLLGAGAGAAAAARLDGPSASAQATGPVKIGVLTIRAGVAAPVGAAGLRATEWWAERTNKAGGILGRQVQLVVEEESNPKDTVERYRKLVLQDQVEVVLGGISTGVTLALGPVAEDLGTPWLSWDGTTQKGVEETMPNPKWAFKSVDNEVEAIVAGILTPKYFKGIKTVAGIGNDYSYGHDCWQTYQAVLRRYVPDVKFVLELFPKLGVTDFTSHIAAIQQAKPDLLMCSFWSGDATIIMKQAAAVGLPANEVEDVLGGDRYRDRVEASTREAHALGADAVPAFVLDRRLLVLGAQPVELFEQAFAQLAGTA